ncbi:cyclin-dependent kinase inhibitor 1B [Salmo salar]|uniref:Cyclin-dependent kinase inhibitor 1B n=1 Tax=Salmo salar TaxID=8030 RepID=A0A1S3KXZ6_SALSA|nr:cyclin-dependent kinase inhibitor 1B [Salmo salar]|eukprot:XP_013983154.1 PREDICTED: cyclin-dependent kinase inhibitor 1B-like [Salmo salar]
MTNFQTPTGLESSVAQRTTLPRRHTSVCRNLFGPIDHDELSLELKAKLKEISERDQRRWNFHFETDTPIPGSYEWEGMSADSTPAFYQESTKVGGMRVQVVTSNTDYTAEVVTGNVRGCSPLSDCEQAALCSNEVNQENWSNSPNTRKCISKSTPCIRHKRSRTTSYERAVNVTQITDFFPKRRRSTSEMKSTQPNSSLSIPFEQTPRKAQIIR